MEYNLIFSPKNGKEDHIIMDVTPDELDTVRKIADTLKSSGSQLALYAYAVSPDEIIPTFKGRENE